ncbi:putative secreted protein with PEP-CTERM sorting signal [Tamaricihabitans halophyticus]|uniref:Putative secreted protein with PEP-CTERM sorting signal n=1 Tax=Tamaricihabitans halophyticus TaxID=1262583 RepID=A0A4R2R0N0_9PSEU|nr:hypothetical protein [Tamaricihabitans halophyticus]TCP55119.1 putative secreted protein with PEP-CTERM sorting signal [Tamaricihabitans halophyticus]
MQNRGNGSGGPEDVDAAFAEIVAGLESEGLGKNLPDQDAPDEPEPPQDDSAGTATIPREQPTSGGWRSASSEWDPTWQNLDALDNVDPDDDHYHPPEPPPLPRPRKGAIIVLVFVLVGLLLLFAPGIFGLTPEVSTPIGLLAVTCALGYFVLSKRQQGPPPGANPDGSQV